MALFRNQRLYGWVRDTAMDWDQRAGRWRVEVRFEGRRVMWSWPATPEGAAQQRREAENLRRPGPLPF